MERVVVSILALVAAATTAISLGIIANDALGIPSTEIRLNALSGAGFMFAVSLAADDGAAGDGGNEGHGHGPSDHCARQHRSCDTPPVWRRSIAWRGNGQLGGDLAERIWAAIGIVLEPPGEIDHLRVALGIGLAPTTLLAGGDLALLARVQPLWAPKLPRP